MVRIVPRGNALQRFSWTSSPESRIAFHSLEWLTIWSRTFFKACEAGFTTHHQPPAFIKAFRVTAEGLADRTL